MTAPQHILEAFEKIENDLSGSQWSASVEDINADFPMRQPSFFTVVQRHVERSVFGDVLETSPKSGVGKGPVSPGQKVDIYLNPKSPMGGENGLGFKPNPSSALTVGSGSDVFASLPSVKAMGSGKRRPVVGFDTEFTYLEDGSRVIDSYQFSLLDPEDSNFRYDVVLLPMEKQRILLEDALFIVSRETGLWKTGKSGPNLGGPEGVERGRFWKGDFYKSRRKLFQDFAIPLVLATHYGKADLTTFARPAAQKRDGDKFDDVMRRVQSASGGLVSLQPVSIFRTDHHRRRWLPFSIEIRDTMAQAPAGSKTLAALGEAAGISKLDVPDSWISDMRGYREKFLLDFLEYGANDSIIVLEYLSRLWGDGVVPPITLSGGGARALKQGILDYWAESGFEVGAKTAGFQANFQGLVTQKESVVEEDDSGGLSYYVARGLLPVDSDADVFHRACALAFHGGLNTCPKPGFYDIKTWDHDLQSAYPTAMALIPDVDFSAPGVVRENVVRRRLTLKDFEQGFQTPFVGFCSWTFPKGVIPCLPVQVGTSIIAPMTSLGAGARLGKNMRWVSFQDTPGAYVMGPEVYLALLLGAEVTCQRGYIARTLTLPNGEESYSLRRAVKQLVLDRGVASSVYGSKSLEAQAIKTATNSGYGKLAQDVAPQNAWNSYAQEMEAVGGSAVTSPYHAAMITSIVRATLFAVWNELPDHIYSITTDGFIASADLQTVSALELFGLKSLLSEARDFLVGDPAIWEVKHEQSSLLNVTTRGNVALEAGGVFAKSGLKSPPDIERGSMDERRWYWDQVVGRDGKLRNDYTTFPSLRELSLRGSERKDFQPVKVEREVSVDYDMKLCPVWETVEDRFVENGEGELFRFATYSTVPWYSVDDYISGKEKARHIADFRPGTTGEHRPTGTLRTAEDMATLEARIGGKRRRVRTADELALTQLVALFKAGLVDVPFLKSGATVQEKLVWLSGLGLGDFTRSKWNHMSAEDRRSKVISGAAAPGLETLIMRVGGRWIGGDKAA